MHCAGGTVIKSASCNLLQPPAKCSLVCATSVAVLVHSHVLSSVPQIFVKAQRKKAQCPYELLGIILFIDHTFCITAYGASCRCGAASKSQVSAVAFADKTNSWLQYCMLVVVLSAKQHHWKSDVASICMHHNQLQVCCVQNIIKKLWRAFSPSQPSMKERWAHEPGLPVLLSGLETLWHGTSQ